jgi:hypothetical protein
MHRPDVSRERVATPVLAYCPRRRILLPHKGVLGLHPSISRTHAVYRR